jgi:RNA polymerase sigma-70 factor, ECF subfamily
VIVRIWHGMTAAAKSDEYLEYLNRTDVPEYRATEGNRGVYVLRTIGGERADFLTVSFWESIEATKGFAGPDTERAKYYPEDEKYLLDFEPTVDHYEVLAAPGDPTERVSDVRNFPGRKIVVEGMKTRTRPQRWAAGFDPLAARLADGDPMAPRALVERHYRELYRYAFSVLREERAAEDAAQDAFERAFAALGRYSEERLRAMRLRPWMYRITLNVARNRLRQRREVPVEDPSVVGGAASDDGRESIMDALGALGELPERQRVAVTLRYLQDLPYAEISSVTGWPEGTAKTLVRRGLMRLRSLMVVEEPEGGDQG